MFISTLHAVQTDQGSYPELEAYWFQEFDLIPGERAGKGVKTGWRAQGAVSGRSGVRFGNASAGVGSTIPVCRPQPPHPGSEPQ
jgi:hypothetical protein